jgi:hypothetical protein
MDLDVYSYLRSQVRAKDSSMASLDRRRAANDGVLDPRQFSSGWLQAHVAIILHGEVTPDPSITIQLQFNA